MADSSTDKTSSNCIQPSDFGGAPAYQLNFTAGFGGEPAKQRVKFVSEDGNYSPPTYDLNSSITVGTGDMVRPQTPVSYSITKGPSGSTLEVEFEDKPIIDLKRTYIVLAPLNEKLLAPPSSACVIVLGEVYHKIPGAPSGLDDATTIRYGPAETYVEDPFREPPRIAKKSKEFIFYTGLQLANALGAAKDTDLDGAADSGGMIGPALWSQIAGIKDYLNLQADAWGIVQQLAQTYGFSLYANADGVLDCVDASGSIGIDAALGGLGDQCSLVSYRAGSDIKGTSANGSIIYYEHDADFDDEREQSFRNIDLLGLAFPDCSEEKVGLYDKVDGDDNEFTGLDEEGKKHLQRLLKVAILESLWQNWAGLTTYVHLKRLPYAEEDEIPLFNTHAVQDNPADSVALNTKCKLVGNAPVKKSKNICPNKAVNNLFEGCIEPGVLDYVDSGDELKLQIQDGYGGMNAASANVILANGEMELIVLSRDIIADCDIAKKFLVEDKDEDEDEDEDEGEDEDEDEDEDEGEDGDEDEGDDEYDDDGNETKTVEEYMQELHDGGGTKNEDVFGKGKSYTDTFGVENIQDVYTPNQLSALDAYVGSDLEAGGSGPDGDGPLGADKKKKAKKFHAADGKWAPGGLGDKGLMLTELARTIGRFWIMTGGGAGGGGGLIGRKAHGERKYKDIDGGMYWYAKDTIVTETVFRGIYEKFFGAKLKEWEDAGGISDEERGLGAPPEGEEDDRNEAKDLSISQFLQLVAKSRNLQLEGKHDKLNEEEAEAFANGNGVEAQDPDDDPCINLDPKGVVIWDMGEEEFVIPEKGEHLGKIGEGVESYQDKGGSDIMRWIAKQASIGIVVNPMKQQDGLVDCKTEADILDEEIDSIEPNSNFDIIGERRVKKAKYDQLMGRDYYWTTYAFPPCDSNAYTFDVAVGDINGQVLWRDVDCFGKEEPWTQDFNSHGQVQAAANAAAAEGYSINDAPSETFQVETCGSSSANIPSVAEGLTSFSVDINEDGSVNTSYSVGSRARERANARINKASYHSGDGKVSSRNLPSSDSPF